jgi:hypothetical protein
MQHSIDEKWEGSGFAQHIMKSGSNRKEAREIQLQNIEIHKNACTSKIKSHTISFETASDGPCPEQHDQSKFAWLDRIVFSVLDDPFRHDWPHW